MKKIVIIDYGLGNLRSVRKGLEHAGADVIISSDPEEIKNADGVILPGVGAFRDAMKNVEVLRSTIDEYVESGKPMLGICLGQQMMLSTSEEGGVTEGLDLVKGQVLRFPHSELKVPHMGWNSIKIIQEHPIFDGIPEGSFVYFVHSYYVDTSDRNTLISCEYGTEFAAAIVNDAGNVIGTQFHPEKSGDTGLKILENFVAMC
ncbi:MAG: imidazole glycerol-phosphate synthase subunit HisH [Methanolobus sp.]|jgi:glutamine amidotransferase|uniref:imidazole glycerol phosphate synthase subunit HisH n=1 Tax=Methanolobus sp. TaxID=1874737 RepID=UPI0024AC5E43|nr:imidazole glycerol phosphate synthase subunit HisH [Methanolobus sp.]MDI3485812.1 imidazole glycerol-phosphate synthase subunit HisH [Methanolobus sp.]MDK2831169.1 imidazole glycerol-phosphate synthase subunit HisH [Methanolobus sp.]MDK2937942.1 imidazole glycerol-phosphate synthase subunit HisH [Methanolobus sp.]